MRIVVLDGYTLNPGDLSWEGFEKYGELTVYDRTSYDGRGEELVVKRAKDADIVLLNKTILSREVMEKLPKLKYVGVLATGYDVIDIEAARELGIIVTNIPTYGTYSVAQMAIALLLEMCNHVWIHNESVKKGEWASNPDWCYWKYPLIELAEKTVGIIGYGRIGQATGRIAQALGMKVVAYDLYQNKALESETMRYVDLNQLLAQSDVIVLHCALTSDTKGIINRESIAKMKDGVMIVNNSRGQLIVEEDLAAALNSGKVAGAAVDVVSREPISDDNPLLKAKNCIITPHISWAPREARKRLLDIAVDNLDKFIAGKPINVVNP